MDMTPRDKMNCMITGLILLFIGGRQSSLSPAKASAPKAAGPHFPSHSPKARNFA